MASSHHALIAFGIALLGTPSLTSGQSRRYSVQATIYAAGGDAIQSAVIELRPRKGGGGFVAAANSTGRVVVSSVEPGTYVLSVEAGGFNNLCRVITIRGDVDLGRIVMDSDPNVLHSHGLEPPAPRSPALRMDLKPRPTSFRGRISPASSLLAKRLSVQLSCSEQVAGLPQRPERDVSLVPVDATGAFDAAVPDCSSDLLAHREIRFSLKDGAGRIVAFLLPKMTGNGFHQSRFGIWIPVKPWLQDAQNEAQFGLEFADNRELQATITVTSSSWGGLQATLTNTSEEVIAVRPADDFFSDPDWIILDEHGDRVPFRLFRDRTGEQQEERLPRSRFLFPGASETYDVNIKLRFALGTPGTYRAVARRIIRRPELPGEQQIVSPESTFVIAPQKQP